MIVLIDGGRHGGNARRENLHPDARGGIPPLDTKAEAEELLQLTSSEWALTWIMQASGSKRPFRFGNFQEKRPGFTDAGYNTPGRFDIGKVVQDLEGVLRMLIYSHLSEDEKRDQIGVLRCRGAVDGGSVARALGRAKATISRELQRRRTPFGRRVLAASRRRSLSNCLQAASKTSSRGRFTMLFVVVMLRASARRDGRARTRSPVG